MHTRTARVAMAVAAVVASGALTATFVSSGGKGSADAATELNQYVPIEQVRPTVKDPAPGARASKGSFTVDCGTNGNGKFSPDNPVAQPGIRNGAEHVHDFVGNLAITANSSNADLDASGTTCRNGDKSSYFWPVVRIDKSVRSGAEAQRALAATTPRVTCPSVRDRLPAVPAKAKRAVDLRLAELDRGYAAANERMAAGKGRIDARLNTAVLADLRQQRARLIKGISGSIAAAGGGRTSGMVSLVECDTDYDGMHAAMRHTAASVKAGLAANPQVRCPAVRDKLPGVPAQALDEVNRNLAELDRQVSEANERLITTRGQGGKNFVDNAILGPLKAKRTAVLDRIAIAISRNAARPQGLEVLAGCTVTGQAPPQSGATPAPSAPAALPDPQGPNLELPNNTGGIVRPASVLIEYRGNATSKVVAMPKFLRALTGDAKPTSRGPANARATWSCSGFADRLADKYPICPPGSQVQRVQDFPGCWDGRNIDSTNHRDHLAFADPGTGACKQGFVAIPQLRITVSYDLSRDVQTRGQYALDSFPEEDHNPFSDHNDFVNVNSDRQMQKIAACINKGKSCR
ncbi:DUF1996 domain-containing protein [Actinoplanes auranticolor]|uniref:DUF1996 domain-containing protein n=1 Tax=Actinoplanes auranticolor TaxID=47988 RepID=A0A919S7R8_9ACTN|nr:DUF1996 domain-containing protein [Actinoplanes auranticolor]GIM65725.1 hypothetical protein Aau02nite_19230 [Actinoplanes auranticolor]